VITTWTRVADQGRCPPAAVSCLYHRQRRTSPQPCKASGHGVSPRENPTCCSRIHCCASFCCCASAAAAAAGSIGVTATGAASNCDRRSRRSGERCRRELRSRLRERERRLDVRGRSEDGARSSRSRDLDLRDERSPSPPICTSPRTHHALSGETLNSCDRETAR
jgi:hypothetical protein